MGRERGRGKRRGGGGGQERVKADEVHEKMESYGVMGTEGKEGQKKEGLRKELRDRRRCEEIERENKKRR